MRIERIMGKSPMPRKRRWQAAAIAVPFIACQFALASAVTFAAGELERWPVAGKVSSSFGKRSDPIDGKSKTHFGIDLVAPLGTPVVAAGSGTVTFAAEKGAYGNFVAIDHGNDTITHYAQLDEIKVRVGQRVGSGDLIATVGSSGRSTGPHLHFEVLIDGKRVDPATVLPAR